MPLFGKKKKKGKRKSSLALNSVSSKKKLFNTVNMMETKVDRRGNLIVPKRKKATKKR